MPFSCDLGGSELNASGVQHNPVSILWPFCRLCSKWLSAEVSKIFLHNLLKWIVPRLFGFLCTRGLYPLLAVDFAEDLLTDLALRAEAGEFLGMEGAGVGCNPWA